MANNEGSNSQDLKQQSAGEKDIKKQTKAPMSFLKDALAFMARIVHHFFPFVNTLHKKSFMWLDNMPNVPGMFRQTDSSESFRPVVCLGAN